MRYIYSSATGTFEKIPKYIYPKKGKFEIRKRIGGILLYWGSFDYLEEAKEYLEYYMGKNWEVTPVFRATRYIRRQGNKFLIIKRINGKLEYFGIFDNLKDAMDERDICVACGWDMDRIVEFDEGVTA